VRRVATIEAATRDDRPRAPCKPPDAPPDATMSAASRGAGAFATPAYAEGAGCRSTTAQSSCPSRPFTIVEINREMISFAEISPDLMSGRERACLRAALRAATSERLFAIRRCPV